MSPNTKISRAALAGLFCFCAAQAKADSTDNEMLSLLNSKSNSTQVGTQAKFNPPTAVSEPMVYIVEQSLPEFLRQAARRSGYQITISSRVRGTLKKMSMPLDLDKILEKIAPQFDLKWHFQQQQVYVSVGSESKTRLIFLGDMNMEDLQKSLEGAGLSANAYDLSYVEESNSVIVNGPTSYIASVELIAESFNKNEKAKNGRIKVIRYGNVRKN